jgi:hypothetical protein
MHLDQGQLLAGGLTGMTVLLVTNLLRVQSGAHPLARPRALAERMVPAKTRSIHRTSEEP